MEGEMFVESFVEGQQILSSTTPVVFPKVYELPSSLAHQGLKALVEKLKEKDTREMIDIELARHGVLVLRGYPLKTNSDFNEFMEALDWPQNDFFGFGFRTPVVGRVSNANEGPLDHEIFFHHECSYVKDYPSKIAFFCEKEPKNGEGQTSFLQSDKVVKRMESMFPEFVKQMEEKGVVYHCIKQNIHNLPSHLTSNSWQTLFNTQDCHVAEQRAEEQGQRIEWTEDGDAHMMTAVMQGVREYAGRRVWFNNIPQHLLKVWDSIVNKWVTLGDGSEVPEDVVKKSAEIMNKECYDHEWRNGDVVLVDNLTVMHCRRASQLPTPRRVVVSFGK